mgnify:CR=1 FL=1
MYDVGKKVYYRNQEYRATIGRILSTERISEALIQLKVLSPDGNVQVIQKIYPDADHMLEVEDNYIRHGHY